MSIVELYVTLRQTVLYEVEGTYSEGYMYSCSTSISLVNVTPNVYRIIVYYGLKHIMDGT